MKANQHNRRKGRRLYSRVRSGKHDALHIVADSQDRMNLTYAARIVLILPAADASYSFMTGFALPEEKAQLRRIARIREQQLEETSITAGSGKRSSSSPDDLADVSAVALGSMRIHKQITRYMNESLLERAANAEIKNPDREERLLAFQKKFRLTETEIAVIACVTSLENDLFSNFLNRMTSLGSFLKILAAAIAIPVAEIRKALRTDGPLRMMDIISVGSGMFPVSVDTEFIEYINGISEGVYDKHLYSMDRESVLPLESFSISENEANILLSLLSGNAACQVLFYGEPGTGKTELARTLVRRAGMQTFFIEQGKSGEVKDRKAALVITSELAGSDGVIIADEADDLLNVYPMFSGSMQKSWINHFMDITKTKIIWITNQVKNIEDSLRRRFDFSLSFRAFNTRERERVWHNILKSSTLQGMVSADFVTRASRHYPVNAAGISRAIACAERMPQLVSENVIETMLGRHTELLQNVLPGKMPDTHQSYDPMSLNTNRNLEELARIVRGVAYTSGADFPMCLLFWGKSGTGKTQFARELAKQCGLSLVEKRVSDLLNPYLGLTERAIREAFHEAQQQEALLLFDEADSLLGDRRGAVRSWERTQTNEFLASLERYRGVFVATTNLLETLDPASLRRFSWKVEFRPLTEEGKLRLFHVYFPATTLNLSEASALSQIRSLTPGDYRSVAIRLAGRTELAASEVLYELASESSYKEENRTRSIGFREG